MSSSAFSPDILLQMSVPRPVRSPHSAPMRLASQMYADTACKFAPGVAQPAQFRGSLSLTLKN